MCFGAIIIIDVVCAYSSIRWHNNISMRDVSFAVQSGYIVKCMGVVDGDDGEQESQKNYSSCCYVWFELY